VCPFRLAQQELRVSQSPSSAKFSSDNSNKGSGDSLEKAAAALMGIVSFSAPAQPPLLPSSTHPQCLLITQQGAAPGTAGVSVQAKTPRAASAGPNTGRASSPESYIASAFSSMFPPGSYDDQVSTLYCSCPLFSQPRTVKERTGIQ
jgi:hypothetical protein